MLKKMRNQNGKVEISHSKLNTSSNFTQNYFRVNTWLKEFGFTLLSRSWQISKMNALKLWIVGMKPYFRVIG